MPAELQDVLQTLHALLEKTGRCFQRGALVVDVTDHVRWAQGVVKKGRKRPMQKTHDVFLDAEKWARRRICSPHCPAMTLEARTAQVEVRLSAFKGCGESKKVALVYLFAVNGRTYMYIKLETHPARSVGHVVAAAARYGFKHSGGSKDVATRREDDTAALNLARANRRVFETPSGNVYDTAIRAGSEMYIPSVLLARLISRSSSTS
jgi:Pyruvate/2-oxoacid:ferredoxin oxidoreductase delta subunit